MSDPTPVVRAGTLYNPTGERRPGACRLITPAGECLAAVVEQFSEGRIRFRLKGTMPPGERITLELSRADGRYTCRRPARVLTCTGHPEGGLKVQALFERELTAREMAALFMEERVETGLRQPTRLEIMLVFALILFSFMTVLIGLYTGVLGKLAG